MASQVPGRPLCAYALLSDPGQASAPSHEDDRSCGESLFPAAFASLCRCLNPLPSRSLAASRRVGFAPVL